MSNFTPYASLLGGALIGFSASLLLLLNGRVAGISGIVGGLLQRPANDTSWRAAFILGLVGTGTIGALLMPALFDPSRSVHWLTVVAGILVGVGTRMGSGCTSGHGICGLSRGSVRSLVAVLTFMVTAGLTIFVIRHVLQVSL